MSPPGGVLGLVDDPALRDDVDRVAAAAGTRVVYCPGVVSRRDWSAAAAVVIDRAAIHRCAESGLPRRPLAILIVADEPDTSTWQTAITLGAQAVLRLPLQERELVEILSDVGELATDPNRGRVVAVVGGHGGAGASIFSAALAVAAGDALLVDVDPWGGGMDLLLGIEEQPGLRWPDVAVEGGRVTLAAMRDALPCHQGISVLSGTRRGGEIAAGPLLAVADGGRRGGATVVCDLSRSLTGAAEAALDAADLVVVVGVCDVRSCASSAAISAALLGVNPNVGFVARGPSPGGLRAAEVARAAGLPLLAAMRPERGLPDRLERGGLRLRRRSSLATAARRVLAVLDSHPGEAA